ncbi:uncharacterized protein LOC132562220 [Ylistrum balloti]|uniref:uncharacterized protein LOC132562220 n=1 Tax=Ylistrum balloti TaxID=509963 RepID=UPI002905DF75|nr:uncharacterized protein LOC132562220 [Ylistrum balloti]
MNADLGYTIIDYNPNANVDKASYNQNTDFSVTSYDPNQYARNYIMAFDPNNLSNKYMTDGYNKHEGGVQPHSSNGVMTSYDPNKLTASYLPNTFNPTQLNAKFTGSFDANSQSDSFMRGPTGNSTTQSESQGTPTVNTNWAGQWKGEWPSKHTAEESDLPHGVTEKTSWNGSWSKSWPGVPDSYGSIDQGVNVHTSATNLHKDSSIGDPSENSTTQSGSQGTPTVNTNWAGQWKGEWPSKHTAEESDLPHGVTEKTSWNGSWSKSWPGVPDSYGSIDQEANVHTSVINPHKGSTNLEETVAYLQELLDTLKTKTAETEF